MVGLFNGKTKRQDVLMFNGDYILDNIRVYDKITRELPTTFDYEGIYRIDKEYPKELYDLLIEGSIIKVDDELGDEIFRIANVRKTKREIEIYARHITIADTLTMWCEDVRPENQNGQGALNWILNNAKGNKELLLSSDIKTQSTAYYEYMNVYEALYTADNSFLNRWGGEVDLKQYNIKINQRIGRDTDIEIRSRKNLIGFEARTNIDSLCTVIYPKGYDLLKASPVSSPLLNNYPNPYYREIKYDDIKVKTENDNEGYDSIEQAQAELIRRAKLEFSEKHIDEIQAEYSIKYVDLFKTEEYKDYAPTEYLNVGDIATVIEDTYDININVRVTKRVYEPYRKRRTETVLSNKDIKRKPPTISDILLELEKTQTEGQKGLSEYINGMINAGLKDSYVVLKPNELLIMDSKDINTAVNVTRYNKNGLGFSTTGYYGNYEYGFTIDGKLNADRIQTGTLTAIMIQSLDGSCSINLDNGEINFTKGIIKGANCSFNLNTGEIRSEFDNPALGNQSFILKNGEVKSTEYVRLTGNSGAIVKKENEKGILASIFIEEMGVMSFSESLTTSVPSMTIWDKGSEMQSFRVKSNNSRFTGSTTSIEGDLNVFGNKNCIQKTKEYGKVPFYSNEDINSLLTKTPIDEIYETTLQESGKYKCIVPISQMIRECINTDLDYNVWIAKLDFGDYKYTTYQGYFVVESDRPMRFKYKLEGVRKGFEDKNEKLVYNKLYGKEV